MSDYYIKTPDLHVRIVTKERNEEDGREKQLADNERGQDSSD